MNVLLKQSTQTCNWTLCTHTAPNASKHWSLHSCLVVDTLLCVAAALSRAKQCNAVCAKGDAGSEKDAQISRSIVHSEC